MGGRAKQLRGDLSLRCIIHRVAWCAHSIMHLWTIWSSTITIIIFVKHLQCNELHNIDLWFVKDDDNRDWVNIVSLKRSQQIQHALLSNKTDFHEKNYNVFNIIHKSLIKLYNCNTEDESKWRLVQLSILSVFMAFETKSANVKTSQTRMELSSNVI